MQRRRLSRRLFLKLAAGASATAVLAACAGRSARTDELAAAESAENPTSGAEPRETEPTEETHSRVFGSGPIEIEVWYQEGDGANALLHRVGEAYAEEHEDATINLQAISYSDLFFGLLPAIAAGDEGDILMMWTNWIVGTDITQVFLDITEPLGGYARFVEGFWEAPLGIVDAAKERVFYLPWLAGGRGSTISVNRDQLAEEGIDPLDFNTWEEVIDAGKRLTRRDAAGMMARAGYAVNASQPCLLYNIIWELGGRMYDKATGTWSWYSDEGVEGVRRLYDTYWTDETSSYDLYANEFQGVREGLISIWGEGAWTASVHAQTAGIRADNIVTPRIADGVTDDLYPDHIEGWGLSRRLADEWDKLVIALDFALTVVGPDATIPFLDDQSSLCMSKEVYEDPRIEWVAYGPMSKRVAMAMWPRARYNGDHVGDMGPAYDALDRALRKEISAEEALQSMDAYCQEQEDAARDHVGL